MLAISSTVLANPLLNVNAEEKQYYDILDSSLNSYTLCTTIKPLDYYNTVPFLDDRERLSPQIKGYLDTAWYFKPLNSLTAHYYYTNESRTFIEDSSGIQLRKGNNFLLFEDGYISFGEYLVFYYQLNQTFNVEDKKAEIFRMYTKLRLYKFALEGGIDNVNLGPGEYGTILSGNSRPYPLVKFFTEEPIRILGAWNFILMQGWLTGKRTDHSSPRVFAIRMAWKPFDFIEAGGTRTAMFGGSGRESCKFWEYPSMIFVKHESAPGSKWDNAAYSAFDLTIHLPLGKLIRPVRSCRIYWEESATDLNTPDRGKSYRFPFGIDMLDRAMLLGLLIGTNSGIFRFEYFVSSYDFYTHDIYYSEGYTYNDMSLGNPYGKDVQCLTAKYRHYITGRLSLEGRAMWYTNPAYQPGSGSAGFYKLVLGDADYKYRKNNPSIPTMHRGGGAVSINYNFDNFLFEVYVRVDRTSKYDRAFSPAQIDIVDENKTLFIAGLSASLRL